MNVTQLVNNQGNAVKNQFVITNGKGQFFQSYGSVIAFMSHNKRTIILTDDWDYSATTLKHLKTFLGTSLSKKEIQHRIDSGSIILNNLIKNEV